METYLRYYHLDNKSMGFIKTSPYKLFKDPLK